MNNKSKNLILQLIAELWLFINDSLSNHPASKVCSKCNQRKLLSGFDKDTRYKNEIRYLSRCKRCKYAQTKQWRKNNADRLNAAARIRARTPKYLEANRTRAARWKQNNRQHYLEQKRMQTWRRRAKDKGIALEQYLLMKDKRTREREAVAKAQNEVEEAV